MAGRLSVSGGEWERLEAAAEWTISAASAALLWAGEDGHGVLARVCAATSNAMVCSRLSAASLADLNPPPLCAAEETHLDRPGEFELAALPSSVAPGWSTRVATALDEVMAQRERARGIGPGTARWAACMKAEALTAIRLWGDDPLPARDIEYLARTVTGEWSRPASELLNWAAAAQKRAIKTETRPQKSNSAGGEC